MTLLQTWSFSLSAAVLLAVMAALGYLLGCRQRRMRTKVQGDHRSEVMRALAVAQELESIAGRLRLAFSVHLPAIARFRRILNRLESAPGASWHDLCDRADELLKPTIRLGTEISHGYAEILRQMAHLASFAELRADPLTGINNRRAFDESLVALLAEQNRYPAPFSLAMIDVDRFKQVNDQHGHLRGDRVLQDLAQILKAEVRDCDLLARFGGEEFAILMPRTELHAACNLAERIRAKVASNMPINVSIGLAAWLPSDTASTLLSRADNAMYAAKDGGRNSVHIHEGTSGRIVGIRTTSDKKPEATASSEPAMALAPAVVPAVLPGLQSKAC